MAKSARSKSIVDNDLKKLAGKNQIYEVKFPTKNSKAAEAKAKAKSWEKQVKTVAEKPKPVKLQAVKLTSAELTKLRSISESTKPSAVAAKQGSNPSQVLGTLFSAMSTLEFTKMESEYKSKLAAAKTPAEKDAVNSQWKNIVKGGEVAFASAGLKNVNESALRSFSSSLVANKQNFNSVVSLANTARPAGTAINLTKITPLTGVFIPVTGVVNGVAPIVNVIENLCSRDFASGNWTKHIHYGFSLTVTIRVWCPTWTNPFRTCPKTITLAGATFDADLSVGYRVNCCGAAVWGSVSANACVTFIGMTFCAGCTASVTGVAGVSKTPIGGGRCNYGIGINAQLKCTFLGVPVLNVSYPFGYTIQGPCPPAGLCN